MSDEPKEPGDRAAAEAAAAPVPALGSAEAKMRAALADSGLQEALRELHDAIEEPDPPAPDPVVVLPDPKGEVLIADTEAAAAYVRPTVRRGGPVPQDTLTRVHVDARVDPRRQPTERRLRSEVLDAAALASSQAPSSRAPSSQPPPSVIERPASSKAVPSSKRPRRGVVWAGLAMSGTLALVVFLVLRPGSRTSDPIAESGTAKTSMLAATGAGTTATATEIEAATGAGAIASAAQTTSGAATDTATGAAASSPGTTSAPAPWTTSARPVSSGAGDPYIDAALPPKSAPSAATSPPSAVPAPSVLPAPTVVPTAPATATTTSRPFAPFTVEKDG